MAARGGADETGGSQEDSDDGGDPAFTLMDTTAKRKELGRRAAGANAAARPPSTRIARNPWRLVEQEAPVQRPAAPPAAAAAVEEVNEDNVEGVLDSNPKRLRERRIKRLLMMMMTTRRCSRVGVPCAPRRIASASPTKTAVRRRRRHRHESTVAAADVAVAAAIAADADADADARRPTPMPTPMPLLVSRDASADAATLMRDAVAQRMLPRGRGLGALPRAQNFASSANACMRDINVFNCIYLSINFWKKGVAEKKVDR